MVEVDPFEARENRGHCAQPHRLPEEDRPLCEDDCLLRGPRTCRRNATGVGQSECRPPILSDLLEKYAEHGTAQFVIPDVLKVPPISERGYVVEIANLFGGPDRLREAVNELQALLYAA